MEGERYHRGAHAGQAVVGGVAVDLAIGGDDDVDQVGLGQLRPGLPELSDGQLGGPLTSLVTTHSVGQRGDRAVEEDAVLVGLPHVSERVIATP